MKHIYFTVTNDLNFDQRMQRICTTLAGNGYLITLVGRSVKGSLPLIQANYNQHRLQCNFNKGPLFYFEFNLRLFIYLLFKKGDAVCAIDLDTILPCLIISKIKRMQRIYDAHELFCEMKEVVSRPFVYRFWKTIEKITVPYFKHGYTVNEPIKAIFKNNYKVDYSVIRNLPLLNKTATSSESKSFIIYQGAVNHGRSFETLIPAFQFIDYPLFIYGDGNFLKEALALTLKYNVQDKVFFIGKALPSDLKKITPKAALGITLFENNGLSNYYSLANRFFDYIHAGIPQLCVAYPAYKGINDVYNIAILVDDLTPTTIATKINSLLEDKELQHHLKQNCFAAHEMLNWQMEQKVLLQFYNNLFLE